MTEQSQKLIDAVVEPVRVSIVEETFSYGVAEKLKRMEVFAVARSENSWLLYAPEAGVFSLAFGLAPDSLRILGFASDDALAEWLG
ncbi:hypothetical protein [Nevskia sp.]|uniref:hypothetical protein n=1 Tax=Nevskia sp. TaxID=1929292 RepID=UPI002600C057|nr:hypothetical protein [Nevskia sp.]